VASEQRETFAFLEDLRLEVRARDKRTLAHFRAEYGSVRTDAASPADLVVTFDETSAGRLGFEAGYRSLRWRIALDAPGNSPARATIDLRGVPRSFGLSLLQGYVVEPLLGLQAPATGHVLLPAAAVQTKNGALLLIGRSRSGKSSLVARSAASGTAVLGDDHVLVGADGCRAFPRRLRLYPDVAQTAPAARAALPARTRLLLRTLGLLRTASGGSLAPPVRVPVEMLGAVVREPVQLARVVVIERREVRCLSTEPLTCDEVVADAIGVLREQRRTLEHVEDLRWREYLGGVLAEDESLLHKAFAPVASLRRLLVPTSLPAKESVAAIAAELDIRG
jgi:hypothetical protein